MRAIWLEDKKLSLVEVEKPKTAPGEALIRIELAGICATDLELIKGYYPYRGILGHEFVGKVVEAPSNPDLIGKRVVADINIACQQCPTCKAGREHHCPQRSVIGIVDRPGALAEYIGLPTRNLYALPDSISDQAAVFIEPLAAACRILEQIEFNKDCRVLLVGAGRLGQLIARVIKTTACDFSTLARYPKQLELLQAKSIKAFTEQSGIEDKSFDIVIEATGSTTGFEIARNKVRPQGTIVLKSTYAKKSQIDLSSLVVDEITLIGSRCGPFEKAIDLLDKKIIDPTDLIEKRYSLKDGLTAFQAAQRKGSLKILISCPN
jgi:threonine dehydrogenase-like Zn-dependent dehydrogenase